jgi:hypothetical protein
MRVADKVICTAAAVLLLFSFTSAPARAQFAGFGGGGGAGGQDMMTQMAPMLEMMKAKMGKRRFAALIQTMGPMMENGGGGLGGMMGGMGGGMMPAGFGGMGMGGGDMMGMLGGAGGGQMMAMLPQLMTLANFGGGGHRRHKHR